MPLSPAGIALDAWTHHLRKWIAFARIGRASSGKIVNRVH
jgi:hypothetical protein